MKLSRLYADPARFQKRGSEASDQTVRGIVAEGIVEAKMGIIPILEQPDGRYVIAGAGHSRFKAISTLAAQDRLPPGWREDGEWGIPDRFLEPVDDKTARLMARTENFNRDNFTPIEEARIFRDWLNENGGDWAEVEKHTHRKRNYIKETMLLVELCGDIQDAVALDPAAGGIDKHVATALAEEFKRYRVDHDTQRDLWHKLLKHADLTPQFIRGMLKGLFNEAAKRGGSEQGFLPGFSLASNVTQVMKGMKDQAQKIRQATRGFAWLMQARRTPQGREVIRAWFPELDELLAQPAGGKRTLGDVKLDEIKDMAEREGEALGRLCAAGKESGLCN